MQYLLDTSVIIDFLREKQEVKDFISTHKEDTLVTSAICEAEIYTGVYREKKENLTLRRKQVQKLFASFYEVFPFDSSQSEVAGQIKSELAGRGSLIDDLDIMIAAAALSSQSVLVTKNPTHFQRIRGLQVIEIT